MKQTLSVIILSVCSLFYLNAQNAKTFILEGSVFEFDSGESLIGANIQIKDGSIGAITDLDGSFRISSPDSCAVLVISMVGYTTQTLPLYCSGASPLEIHLESPIEVLEEEITMSNSRRERKKIALFRSNKASQAYDMVSPGYPVTASPVPYQSTMQHQPKGDGGIRHNTEDYSVIAENQFLGVRQEPLSTFSIDVDAAAYSNIRRFVNNGALPPKDAVRIEEMVNYFQYDYPQPKGDVPFSVNTELSDCPWNPAHQLIHIGLQGKAIPTEDLPASNLVFLIDVSGSMDAPNKLQLLKSSFKLLTDQMRPKDKVGIVVYASASGVVLNPTAGNKKSDIIDALNKLQAGGSTAGGAGIELAYKLAQEHFIEGGNNRVILATDGDFNVGNSSDAELVRMIEEKRKSGIYLTVLGFGMGNYKDNKMQELAKHGNGNHAYIDNIEEARKVLVSEFGGTMFTIAKDVKLQLEFNPAYVAGYRLIGYENRLLQNEDFNDDKKDAGEMGAGHTVTALYEIIPAGTESAFLKDVDGLKYQETPKNKGVKNQELMTVKLRYKLPNAQKSQLLQEVLKSKGSSLEESSDNVRWSAAVAELGLLLRSSEFKGEASFEQALELAKSAKGNDEEGYRAEFIRMLKSIRDLTEPISVEKD